MRTCRVGRQMFTGIQLSCQHSWLGKSLQHMPLQSAKVWMRQL